MVFVFCSSFCFCLHVRSVFALSSCVFRKPNLETKKLSISLERKRQRDELELIATENYASMEVMAATGSVLTNKYAEGLPKKRYYGGCEHVDVVENIARKRARSLFMPPAFDIGVNRSKVAGQHYCNLVSMLYKDCFWSGFMKLYILAAYEPRMVAFDFY